MGEWGISIDEVREMFEDVFDAFFVEVDMVTGDAFIFPFLGLGEWEVMGSELGVDLVCFDGWLEERW